MAQELMTRPIAVDELALPERAAAVAGLLAKLGVN